MSRTRYDRIENKLYGGDERLRESADVTLDVDPVERIIRCENGEFWGFYNGLDRSQAELQDMVDPFVDVSQSSVSRIIRELDDRVLHDPASLRITGRLQEGDLDIYPDEWLQAYRDALADAFIEIEALHRLTQRERRAPQWAAEMYPEFVGVYNPVARNLGLEESKIQHDTHLSGMESVNIERWARREIPGLSG